MSQPNTQQFFRKCFIFFGVTTGLFQSCEKDPEALTTNSMIFGHVAISSSSEPSGIKVVANGPYGHSTSSTDGYGNYVVEGLGNGTYFLDFSKKGFGTVRKYNVRLFGGDTARVNDVLLFEKPGDFEIPELTKAYIKRIRYTEDNMSEYIRIETNVNKYYDYQIIFFMSESDDVSWDKHSFSARGWPLMLSLNPEVLAIDIQNYGLPFQSGTKVYVRAYPCNITEWQYGGYLDIYRGTVVMSTLDKSRHTNAISFVMP